MTPASIFKGVVRGSSIDLERPVGLPDGQEVTVVIQPTNGAEKLPPGEGLRRSFGAWAEDADELDAYLEWNRRQRKQTRGGAGE
jgi:hypothetical protein